MEIGQVKFKNQEAQKLVQQMARRISDTGMGLTLVDDNLTLRFSEDGYPDSLVQISMIIVSVDNSEPDPEDMERED